jgi:hypothetical protein
LRTSAVAKIAIVQILAFPPSAETRDASRHRRFTTSAVIGRERTRAPTGSAPVGAQHGRVAVEGILVVRRGNVRRLNPLGGMNDFIRVSDTALRRCRVHTPKPIALQLS